MKPEHFCSGNGVELCAGLVGDLPSMKPEHFCSGNVTGSGCGRICDATFNEAGAFLLRKPKRRKGSPPINVILQ